jgi:hypothetical protein
VVVVAANQFPAGVIQLVDKFVLSILRAAEVELAVEVHVGSVLHVDGAVRAIVQGMIQPPRILDFDARI